MAKLSAYTIHGPCPQESTSPQNSHKSLPIRRETRGGTGDLRTLFRYSADGTDLDRLEEPKSFPNGVPETHRLPPTPPTPPATNGVLAQHEHEESAADNSQVSSKVATPVTPTIQQSPPTPDDTPPRELKLSSPRAFLAPRPLLATQPSVVSTRAASFKTAREDITSDDDSVFYGFESSLSLPRTPTIHHRVTNGAHSVGPSGLGRSPMLSQVQLEQIQGSEEARSAPRVRSVEEHDEEGEQRSSPQKEMGQAPIYEMRTDKDRSALQHPILDHAMQTRSLPTDTTQPNSSKSTKAGIRRGTSLRDRLKAAEKYSPSASTERFASIIGWTNDVGGEEAEADKRFSGVSTTSTVSAMVFASSPLSRRRTTLRKVAKTESLRAVSLPLPAPKRESANSSSDSPHRLMHKKVRLSNDNRLSFGSEPSRSQSLSSSAVLPKPEIIKVAVIPERTSSLQSSTQSSRRHSLSSHSARTHSKKDSENPQKPPSSWQRKRTVSESAERGRQEEPTLVVPPRKSSLSAPTSRSVSRSNSISSEHYRSQRKKAETDLRKTLDRMESDRLVSSLRTVHNPDLTEGTPTRAPRHASQNSTGTAQIGTTATYLQPHSPGTAGWADLRPPSALQTPFSQPSYQSASPEINEATAVNLFPHNNASLQVIDSMMADESRAVKEVRKPEYTKDDVASTQSPLRNPRRPPQPPQFQSQVVSSTLQHEVNRPQSGRFGSLRKRPESKRGDSFMKTLSRGLSLRNTTNRKRSEDDGKLDPFWKPQGFWDGLRRDGDMHSDDENESEADLQRDRGVMNSLGLPQERTVVTGPMSLVRRISERRRQDKQPNLSSKSSTSSLARLRASKQLYRTNTFGMNLRFLGLRDMRDHLLYARYRKEEQRREQRRQQLRGKIGNEITVLGDSRFPASDISLDP